MCKTKIGRKKGRKRQREILSDAGITCRMDNREIEKSSRKGGAKIDVDSKMCLIKVYDRFKAL